MEYYNSYEPSSFGNYRTRTFCDIWNSVGLFLNDIQESGLKIELKQDSLINLYYLLYSRYGNNHIANFDENQFKYKVYSTIFMYGPTWEKKLEIQTKIRSLDLEKIKVGGKSILNHSYNPSTEPTTDTLEELPTINEQNTSNYKKGDLEAYTSLWQALVSDVSNNFLNMFKKLFITVVEPNDPLWYTTNIEGEE